jgi:hypothetical protein
VRWSWEADDPAGVIDDVLLGCWFEPSDVLEAVGCRTVGDRHGLSYRLRINAGERFVCEQTAYYDVTDGRIGCLRILCSGFRPCPARSRVLLRPRPGGVARASAARAAG